MATPHIDIGRLSVDERLRLVERLWESLAENPHSIPLTPSQRAELDRRLDSIDRDGAIGIAWDDMVARLRTTGR
ncbi:MAG: addiction module protein [Armatimonadetes bacterium]|nr:addiction module protein [Armatimonadota bacterium]